MILQRKQFLLDLNSLECLVEIGVRVDEYGEKNKVTAVITPQHRAYTDFIKSCEVNCG
jgi:hypothetical protein